MHPVARKILLSAAALAMIVPLSGCADRLLPSAFDQTAPAVNGDNVVWEDARAADAGDGSDVWMYNVGNLIQQQVAGGRGEQEHPAISNKYVVWTDDRQGLMARALLSNSQLGPPISVATGGATQTDPAVCGSLVVWSDPANNSNIYARDLDGVLGGGAVIPVATSPAVEAYPDCDAGRVVYSSSPLGGISDVKLYDIAAQQTRDVANQPYNEWRPAISGNRVVWQAWPGPDINILGTNLATGQNFTVTDAAENQTGPVISGSTVAWEDTRQPSHEPQIWWRDVATTMPQTGIPVESSVTGPQLLPSVSSRRVVFQNSSTGPWQVYIGQLFFLTGTG
jgi:hypothetical protein